MSTPVTDRMRDALSGISRALNPDQVFAMTWEYSVIDAKPGPPTVIDCAVIDPETSAHLPSQLTGLVLWPGPSGFVAVPAPNSVVRIGFVNGDPSKPIVVGLDPNSTPVTVMGFAGLLQLGDASAQPVAHALWLSEVVAALQTFAGALSASVTLANVIACGPTLTGALATATPSPTTKVLAT